MAYTMAHTMAYWPMANSIVFLAWPMAYGMAYGMTYSMAYIMACSMAYGL